MTFICIEHHHEHPNLPCPEIGQPPQHISADQFVMPRLREGSTVEWENDVYIRVVWACGTCGARGRRWRRTNDRSVMLDVVKYHVHAECVRCHATYIGRPEGADGWQLGAAVNTMRPFLRARCPKCVGVKDGIQL